jgi:hypothetical protein
MHDCQQAQAKLVELLFGALKGDERERAVALVNACPTCAAEYRAMQAALRAFDQAAKAVRPAESYWAGYEARLRAKLAAPVAPTRWEQVVAWFPPGLTGLGLRAAWPVALGLLLVAAAFWLARPASKQAPGLVVTVTPTPSVSPPSAPPAPINAAPQQRPNELRPALAVNPHRPRPRRKQAAPPVEALVAALPSAEPRRPTAAEPWALTPPIHFEKAQLLLRSFRNVRVGEQGWPPRLAYEKQQAHRLLTDNILLRRAAEAQGHFPVEAVLSSLEPLLLDIANLPDKPARGAVETIRERIQKQEIIATLQIVSASAERFDAPGLLHQ